MDENDLKINKYKLDDECVHQPQNYYEWAKAYVYAQSEAEAIAGRLKILRAKVEKRIRANPDEYGIVNVTESAIKAAIILHPKVRKLTKRHLKALFNERLLEEGRRAMQQKKNMLEVLGTLNVQLHFAEPNLNRRVEEKKRVQQRKKISKRLKVITRR